MIIRRAENRDISKISELLVQVLNVHHEARPDIFKSNTQKYTDDELRIMLLNTDDPIFVATDTNDCVVGYAFCKLIIQKDNHILNDKKTIYIDDLCVDEKLRGQHIGRKLYDHVKEYATSIGCDNITLNVWADNESAHKFYQKLGLKAQRIVLEMNLYQS